MPAFVSIMMSLQILFINKQSCFFFSFLFQPLLISHLEKKEHSVGQILCVFVFCCYCCRCGFGCFWYNCLLFVGFFSILDHVQEKNILSASESRSRSSLFALISTGFVDCNYTHNLFDFIMLFFTVPFRDSVLTKLLKNALGGNSKTIMVSFVSSCKNGSKDRGQQ